MRESEQRGLRVRWWEFHPSISVTHRVKASDAPASLISLPNVVEAANGLAHAVEAAVQLSDKEAHGRSFQVEAEGLDQGGDCRCMGAFRGGGRSDDREGMASWSVDRVGQRGRGWPQNSREERDRCRERVKTAEAGKYEVLQR